MRVMHVSYMSLKAHFYNMNRKLKSNSVPMRFVAAVGGCFEPSLVIVMVVFVLRGKYVWAPPGMIALQDMLLCYVYNF
jgi:hypothetical protein